MKRLITILVILFFMFAIWLENYGGQPVEPVWRGHTLSQWLDAYDTSLRFPDETPPRAGYSDKEIEQALDGIGERALPFLIRWLQIKPDTEASDWQGRAENGFMYYGPNALPLLPKLDKLTHSHDAEMRMVAYEATFFTRPPKEKFIPIADRALKEKDTGVQGMTAQWMIERFTDEADKRGLRKRYPQFVGDSTIPN